MEWWFGLGGPGSHFASIAAVVAIAVIFGLNVWLHNKIKSRVFAWYCLSWFYALCVRLYIMMTDLWPSTFHFEYEMTVLNDLMALAYISLGIGTFIKVKEIYRVWKNGNGNNQKG